MSPGASGINRFFFLFLFLLLTTPGWAIKVCPFCKAQFDDGVNFCPFDGKPLRLEKKVDGGKVEIQVSPVHAELLIDGINRGKGPKVTLELPPGEHKLEVQAAGFSSQKLKFSVAAGQSQTLSLELEEVLGGSLPHIPATDPGQTPPPASPLPENDPYAGMVEIRGSSYLLGSERGNSDERPLRRITTPGFFIDRYEVTCAQYQKFLEAVKKEGHKWCHPFEPVTKDHTPFHTYAWALKFSWVGGRPPSGMEDFPVVLVDWFDAYAYAKFSGKRLPSEDEWEIAGGGGDGRDFPWGNSFGPEKCAIGDTPQKIGSFPEGKSPWGVEDLAGNVAEWTATAYETDARDGKPFGGRFGQPIIRGGSWDDNSKSCRISARDVHRTPYYRSTTVGFRCVKDKPGVTPKTP